MSSGFRPASAIALLGGLGADLARGASRCLRVLGLADADDRDVAVDVVEGRRVSPIRRLDHGREANVRRMATSLDAAARAEAVAGNLNLLEFTREDMRWQRPHTILEEDGVLLFAGASDFPAYNNGVHRVDDTDAGRRRDREGVGVLRARAGAASRSGSATPARTTTSRPRPTPRSSVRSPTHPR